MPAVPTPDRSKVPPLRSSRSSGTLLRPVAERQAALEARFPGWRPRALHEMLDAAADEFPDRPFVVTDGATFTYRELADWSVRIAGGLVAAGIRPGEHVALVMGNHPEFVAVAFGIARAGAVCVPVNFLNRRDELGYVLRQSDAVALITMDRFRDLDYLAMLDELSPGWESTPSIGVLRKVIVFGEGRPAATALDELTGPGATVDTAPNATAVVLYTSGTTGEPKGVLLTHDMLLRTAYGSAFGRAFQDGRRITFSLPMYHVYGYVEGLLAVLFVGGAIIPQLAFSPAATLDAIARHRADDALFIPTMTAAVLDALGGADVPSLTSAISSGGVSPTGLWDRIHAELAGVEMTTGYGMSEVTASSTVTRPDDPPVRRATTNGRLRDVGVAGAGAHLVDYRVVEPVTRADVAPGGIGELLARGPGVTSGYYRKPEETALAFADGGADSSGAWLRTGDLGRIDADGYLTLVGRVKECYRCGGEQVMPKEVEDVLTAHPSVAQAHVVPLPDARMGEVGVAWIVARAPVDPDAVIAFCAQRLARFKVPRHVLTIDAANIPVTPSGRPRKFLLAELAATRLEH